MTSQNSAFCQRVLYFGLRRMTNDTALIRSGFLFWREQLSSEPFDIDKVVMALIEYLGLGTSEKKSMMISMHSANNKLYEELPVVPEFLLKLSGSGGVERSQSSDLDDQIVASRSPHYSVLNKYLMSVVSFLERFDLQDFSEYKSILRDEGVDTVEPHLSRVIIAWAKNNFSELDLPEGVSEGECYDIAHGAYLLLTEVIGPVEADGIVSRAIDETLKIAEAARFSPRNLI